MGGHTTDGPGDGCSTKVDFGFLIGVKPFANHPRLIPAGGAKSRLERFAGRDRDRLKRTLYNIDLI